MLLSAGSVLLYIAFHNQKHMQHTSIILMTHNFAVALSCRRKKPSGLLCLTTVPCSRLDLEAFPAVVVAQQRPWGAVVGDCWPSSNCRGRRTTHEIQWWANDEWDGNLLYETVLRPDYMERICGEKMTNRAQQPKKSRLPPI